jgi:hypothetical protein
MENLTPSLFGHWDPGDKQAPTVRPPTPPHPHHILPLYLGVDPGASGGLALLRQVVERPALGQGPPAGWELVMTPLACLTLYQVRDWLSENCCPLGACHAVIEQVGGFIRGNPTPGGAMFQFGRSYGRLEALLVALNIPHEYALPYKWQRVVGITQRKKGEARPAWKKRLQEHAQRLYPLSSGKITRATADAVLLAEFCRRTRGHK